MRRVWRCSVVVFIRPDIRTDWIEPRTDAVVPTRFCVASFHSFRRFPIRFDTQVCACVDKAVRTIGTMLIAPTCLDKSAMPTTTSISRAQVSFSSLKILVMLSTSMARQRLTRMINEATHTCGHESNRGISRLYAIRSEQGPTED